MIGVKKRKSCRTMRVRHNRPGYDGFYDEDEGIFIGLFDCDPDEVISTGSVAALKAPGSGGGG